MTTGKRQHQMSSVPNDILRFINSLLETEPGERNSVQFSIDTGGDDAARFQVYLMIMTEILKRWYRPPINLGGVSEANFARLVGYFASFGVDFHLEVVPTPTFLHINNSDYLNKTRLADMKFQMVCEGNLYTVRFCGL
jgi:hypothetical protein